MPGLSRVPVGILLLSHSCCPYPDLNSAKLVSRGKDFSFQKQYRKHRNGTRSESSSATSTKEKANNIEEMVRELPRVTRCALSTAESEEESLRRRCLGYERLEKAYGILV